MQASGAVLLQVRICILPDLSTWDRQKAEVFTNLCKEEQEKGFPEAARLVIDGVLSMIPG